MTVEIDLQINSSVSDLPDEAEFRRWAETALMGRREQAEMTIRLVDEEESLSLNREYRGQEKPTNVLSFPTDAPDYAAPGLLGDLVICAPVVQREAALQNKSPQAHWAHMVVHGTLHLLGLDHQTEREAEAMERAEATILARLGFPDPYAGESGR